MPVEVPVVRAYILAVCVFVPVMIASYVMLRSARRALRLSLVFTAGAAAGFMGTLWLGWALMRYRPGDPTQDMLHIVLVSAGALAGGVLAVFILGKISKSSPWRRS